MSSKIAVKIGNKTCKKPVTIGAGNPVAIQSMCNVKTEDTKSVVDQILALEKEKCDIIRVAVPTMKAAKNIPDIKKHINIPLVADIHFDYKLALASIENGADKIRINPGNIGDPEKVVEILEAAKKAKIPIRIGVNSGSFEKDIEEKYLFKGKIAEGMIESTMRYVKFFEKHNFKNIVLSLKTPEVMEMIKAHKKIAKMTPYPLHIGITSAGTRIAGTVKNSLAIGHLLLNGIGNTIRVSMASDPIEQVRIAKEILRAVGLYSKEPSLIACPTCGRTEVDVYKIAEEVEKRLRELPEKRKYQGLKLAVMGCIVNGPGESKTADYALIGGKHMFAVYKKGKFLKTIKEKNAVEEFIDLIK
jgi:(E)-4-hydroxy-3-methylbut-2-enyl-diphosphate synthase